MKAHGVIIDHAYLKEAWFTEPFVAHLFSYLMVISAHCGFRFDGMDVESGTVLTSLKTISEETGMSVARVRKSLGRLSDLGEVTVGRRKNLTVITVHHIAEALRLLDEVELRQESAAQPQQYRPRQSQPVQTYQQMPASQTPSVQSQSPAGRLWPELPETLTDSRGMRHASYYFPADNPAGQTFKGNFVNGEMRR